MLKNRIFQPLSAADFNDLALEIFLFQYQKNAVYRQFCNYLKRRPEDVKSIDAVPFMPVELFKHHRIVAGEGKPELLFESSGTTGMLPSRHEVLHREMYETSFRNCFQRFYGNPTEYRILALLPNYLERSGSSLVYMAEHLIRASGHPDSGFYLYDLRALRRKLQEPTDRKTLLLGVSFALLDLAEAGAMELGNTIVMETGGMKGRRKELTRTELHEKLCEGLGVTHIHSEYGMTELLSQAYASRDGFFSCPPWMALRIRDMNDPLSTAEPGSTGGVNVIDLANLYSCSFLATSDLGRQRSDGSVEILGRFDFSDLRGCNLMV